MYGWRETRFKNTRELVVKRELAGPMAQQRMTDIDDEYRLVCGASSSAVQSIDSFPITQVKIVESLQRRSGGGAEARSPPTQNKIESGTRTRSGAWRTRRKPAKKKNKSTAQRRDDGSSSPLPTMGLLVILFVGLFVVILLSMAAAEYPDYMYAGVMSPEEYRPIHEFLGNETGVGDSNEEKDEKGGVKLPPFLSSVDSGHRIVEFYAPWCPHCRHFKNTYIKFARDLEALATRFGVRVDVHAVSCVPHRAVCRAMDVHGYPTIRLYEAGSINGTEVQHSQLHPFHVLETLGVEMKQLTTLERFQFSVGALALGHAGGDAVQAVSAQLARSKEEMFSDAFLSFDFALRQGVFMSKGALVQKRKKAFLNWINLLFDTMPPTWAIHRQISAIRDNHIEAVESEENLLNLIDPFRPETQDWSPACTHGEVGMGYTCGLWELFHIMSVGVVEFNKLANEWTIITPSRVADKLRDYIDQFFGCEVCRFNFLAAYDACAYNRCSRLVSENGQLSDWKQLPLWLWETHNAVNVRLMKERAERDGTATSVQDEIDVQWPSRHDCPPCWRGDGSWDEDNIFEYLKLEYWPDDGVNSAAIRQRLSPSLEHDTKTPSRDTFPFLLVGFCCTAFAFIVYIFREKSRLDRSGRHKKVDSISLDP